MTGSKNFHIVIRGEVSSSSEKEFVMKTRLIIEGNAVYEIDEECMERKKKEREEELRKRAQKEQKLEKAPVLGAF